VFLKEFISLHSEYFLLQGIARGFQKQTSSHAYGIAWPSGALTGNHLYFGFNSKH